jgi:hypothetical protein
VVVAKAYRPNPFATKISFLMAAKNQLKIIYIPVEKIVLDERNARTHPEFQIQQIADSIKNFGMNNPVGVYTLPGGDTFKLIFGEGRTIGATRAGLAKIPAVLLDHLSERERRAYALADNKIALNSGWNYERLMEEADYLMEVDGFDFNSIGFNNAEIDAILREDAGIIPNDSSLQKEIFVRPHYREGANESEKPTKPKKEVFSVSVSFKNEGHRDNFLDEMKKRKLRAVILK